MTCPRCRRAMRLLPGIHHNQRLWRCPHCHLTRRQRHRPKK